MSYIPEIGHTIDVHFVISDCNTCDCIQIKIKSQYIYKVQSNTFKQEIVVAYIFVQYFIHI